MSVNDIKISFLNDMISARGISKSLFILLLIICTTTSIIASAIESSELPPSATIAIAFEDPFGYISITSKNDTITAAYKTDLLLWVNITANSSVYVNFNGNVSIVNSTGWHVIARDLEDGTYTLTVSVYENSTQIYVIMVTVTVLTFEETQETAIRTKKTNVDPTYIKYIYAVLSIIGFMSLGISIGETIKMRTIKKVREL